MFGIGFGELLVIGALLLLVVGPKRLPKLMRQAGQTMRELRRAAFELRRNVGWDEYVNADFDAAPPRPLQPARDAIARHDTEPEPQPAIQPDPSVVECDGDSGAKAAAAAFAENEVHPATIPAAAPDDDVPQPATGTPHAPAPKQKGDT